MFRNRLFTAALTAGVLAAPAIASADQASVVAGPLKVKGYAVTITATDGGATDSFAVMALKKAGGSTQMHQWSFSGVSVSVKGGKATLKGDLGPFGKVNGTVAAAKAARGRVPAGCKGTPGTARTGTLTGRTKLVLDQSFFRTLAAKKVPAQIVRGGKLDCGTSAPGQTQSGLTLMGVNENAGSQLMVSVTKAGGKVTQQVMRMDPASGAASSIMHIITAPAGAAGLEAAADLSSATAKAAGPFLGGTLGFAGEGMGTMATGTLSGDFTAKFDSIGAQSLAPNTDGTLMQR